MKILAVSPADDSRRFATGFPPRGDRMLRFPNPEIIRLATRAAPSDSFVYLDEQVEEVNFDADIDLVLLYVNFGREERFVELATSFRHRRRPVAAFGPVATLAPDAVGRWADTVVVGDIRHVWGDLVAALGRGSLPARLIATRTPTYTFPRRELAAHPFFVPGYQATQAVLGCSCPESLRSFCPRYLYYGDEVCVRDILEVMGEVVALPHKHIFLLDEDISRFPDYYERLFRQLWEYRREWTVQAGQGFFLHPSLMRILPKAGVRVIFLTESWFEPAQLFPNGGIDRAYLLRRRREVKALHAHRMLVGARVLVGHEKQPIDYNLFYAALRRLRLDFLEIRALSALQERIKPGTDFFSSDPNRFSMPEIFLWPDAPVPSQFPTGYLWLKDRFYSLDAIINRTVRSMARTGFYTTAVYGLPRNFAYRLNFLEGIPFPP